MLGLAAAEFVLGKALANPIVTADGGHSATDGISTVVSGIVKLITGNHPSHWVKVHFPAKTGICICWATIGGIAVATVLNLRSPSHVVAKSAITAVVLGAFGALVRYGLAKLMEKGHEPTDIANAGHLRTDAWVSIVLGLCGLSVLGIDYLVPWLGAWLFRFGAVWILYKAYKANRHIMEEIKSNLEACEDCAGEKKAQLDE